MTIAVIFTVIILKGNSENRQIYSPRKFCTVWYIFYSYFIFCSNNNSLVVVLHKRNMVVPQRQKIIFHCNKAYTWCYLYNILIGRHVNF